MTKFLKEINVRIINLLNQTISVYRNPEVQNDFTRTFFLARAGGEKMYESYIVDLDREASKRTYADRQEFAENVIVMAYYDLNDVNVSLPPPELDTMFIVTEDIAENATGRDDLLFPIQRIQDGQKMPLFKMLGTFKHRQFNQQVDG